MQQMRAKGERFTVSELVENKALDSDDGMEVIESAAARVRGLILKRTAVSANFASVPPGRRRVLWAETNLAGYDGWALRWTDFGRELDLTREELLKVQALTRHPPRDPRWDYQSMLSTAPVGGFVAKRVVAQTLANALLYECQRTNLPAAHAHLRALIGMTVLHERGMSFVNQMIRLALVGLAASASWEALQAPGWTEPQLADLQAEWRKCEIARSLIGAVEMERALALAYFDSLPGPRGYPPFSSPTVVTNWFVLTLEKFVLGPVYKVAWSGKDKWMYLSSMQSSLEALREFARHRSWKLVKPALEDQFAEHRKRTSGFGRYRYPATHQLMPNLLKAFTVMVKNQTQQQLVLAAIAIKRHQLRTGKLPASLNELVPDYLPELPTDYWDGRPLRFRPNADGTFLLFACGENLRDDGGDPVLDATWETAEFSLGKVAPAPAFRRP